MRRASVLATTGVVGAAGCWVWNALAASDLVDPSRLLKTRRLADISRPGDAQSSLAFHGATVVSDVLDRRECNAWADTVKREAATARGRTTGAKGRTHVCVNGDGERQGTEMRALAARPALSARAASFFGQTPFEVTQLQLLLAEPGSTHQIWHRDNSKRGLTAIIALCDVGANGPTELILRSHDAPAGTLARGQQPVLGTMRAGDALLYDARVLHRGRGYTEGPPRPVLVIRWDALGTPPPGTGVFGTLASRALAQALVLASHFGAASNP